MGRRAYATCQAERGGGGGGGGTYVSVDGLSPVLNHSCNDCRCVCVDGPAAAADPAGRPVWCLPLHGYCVYEWRPAL